MRGVTVQSPFEVRNGRLAQRQHPAGHASQSPVDLRATWCPQSSNLAPLSAAPEPHGEGTLKASRPATQCFTGSRNQVLGVQGGRCGW